MRFQRFFEPVQKAGYQVDAMPLNVRSWESPACHAHHDRDINAALNIKRQGIIQQREGNGFTRCWVGNEKRPLAH